MADEIQIVNVGGEKGVASEATLRRLLASMDKMAKTSGKDSSSQQKKLQEAYNRSIRNSTNELDDNADALDDHTSAVKRNRSAMLGFAGIVGNALMSGVSGLASSFGGLAKELVFGGNKIGDFTRHLPVFGEQLGAIGDFLDGQVETYRDLSVSGANFGNSLIEMNRVAIASNLSLGDFVEAVGRNSERMAFFGTNVEGGAKAFGQVSRALRNGQLGERLFNMGFSMNDLNEGIINYTQLQSRLGRVQTNDTDALAESSASYLEEMDRLARITGTNRRQQEQIALQNAQQANVAVMLGRLEGQARTNFQNNLNFVSSELPAFSGAFQDLADGVAQTDIGQRLASLSPEFAQLAEDAASGRVGQEELQSRLRALAPTLEQFANDMGAAGITALSDQDAGFSALFSGMFQFREFMNKTFNEEEARAAQARRDALTSLGTNFNNTITTLRNTILDNLINNGTFERITTWLNTTFPPGSMSAWATNFSNFIDEFTQDPKGKIMEVFTNAKNAFLEFLLGPLDEAGERMGGGFMDTVTTTLQPIFTKVGDMIGNVLSNAISRVMDQYTGGGTATAGNIATGEAVHQSGILGAIESTFGVGGARIDRDAFLNQATRDEQFFGGVMSMLDNSRFGIDGYLGRVYSELASTGMSSEEAKNTIMEQLQRYVESNYQGAELETMQQFLRDTIQNKVTALESYSSGTQGFRNFGSGTLAMLHGMEAVVPQDSPEGRLLMQGAATGGVPTTDLARTMAAMTGNNNQTTSNGTEQAIREMHQGLMATISQDGTINAINELNNTMSQAIMILNEIKNVNKRQVSATESIGSVY